MLKVYKTWRSEFIMVFFFLTTLISSVYLSQLFPWSIIRGDIWHSESGKIFLTLPLFWLIPAFILGITLIRIYDVKYTFYAEHFEARYGIVSLKQRVVRIRYNDIRGVEVIQSLTDRLLRVGIVEVSTAATGIVDVIMDGVSDPRQLQEFILSKRDQKVS